MDKHKEEGLIYRTCKRGIVKGLSTTWMLAKIVIPVQFFVILLKQTHLLNQISMTFEPLMSVFGLTGDASLALVLGNAINIYAAIGVIATIDITAKQATIIAVMLSFSHSLPVESAVAKKTGISVLVVIIIRIFLAVAAGLTLNCIL